MFFPNWFVLVSASCHSMCVTICDKCVAIISVCDEQLNSKIWYCNEAWYCHMRCLLIAWARSMCLSSNLYEKEWSGCRESKDWLKGVTCTAGSEFPWSFKIDRVIDFEAGKCACPFNYALWCVGAILKTVWTVMRKQLSIAQNETVTCAHADLQFLALEMSLQEHNVDFIICRIMPIPLCFHSNSWQICLII